MMGTAVKYVAALNVDTKLVKCFVYAVFRESSRVEVVGSAYDHVSETHRRASNNLLTLLSL